SSPDAWAGAPIRSLLLEELALPVHLDHDSRAALVGESWSQPGLLDNAALVLADEGLGASLRLDGAMVRGAHSQAGEIGHTVVRLDGLPCACGRRGCAQAEYLAAAAAGDHALAARVLASVVLDLVRLVDVDRVVLGGRSVYTHHRETMEAVRQALGEGLRAEARVRVEVLLPTLGIDLIAAGAACQVLEHEYGLPTALVGPETDSAPARGGRSGGAGAEDRRADAHDRRALLDRDLEVSAHAHRQLRQLLGTELLADGVPQLPQLARGGADRVGIARVRPDRHQADGPQHRARPQPLGHRGDLPGRRGASALGVLAGGLDLHQHVPLHPGHLGAALERIGDPLAVHAVDRPGEGDHVAGLVGLQAADEVAGHAVVRQQRIGVLGDLLGAVLPHRDPAVPLAQ